MSKYKYFKTEQQINNVLKYHDEELKKIKTEQPSMSELDSRIQESEGNHVQIYIKDDDHSLGNIYRDLYIKHDMSFSIPFSLKDGSGQLKVIRDGKTILNEKVTK